MNAIVFDSSMLLPDFHLESPLMKVLESKFILTKFELIFPEAVVLELVKNYSSELNVSRKGHESFNRLTKQKQIDYETELQKLSQKYERGIRRKLSKIGRIWKTPRIDSGLMLRRILNNAKPFKSNEAGVKDYIIWLTALEAATAYDRVVFVSGNHRDFGKDKLHDDLMRDLNMAGINNFSYYSDKSNFLKSELEPMKQLEQSVKDGTIEGVNVELWLYKQGIQLLPENVGYLLDIDEDQKIKPVRLEGLRNFFLSAFLNETGADIALCLLYFDANLTFRVEDTDDLSPAGWSISEEFTELANIGCLLNINLSSKIVNSCLVTSMSLQNVEFVGEETE